MLRTAVLLVIPPSLNSSERTVLSLFAHGIHSQVHALLFESSFGKPLRLRVRVTEEHELDDDEEEVL